ncbi:hypothetical protein IIC38_16985 [candidate division KSB1 bacterium]|nr:hypothetical protein [candidate division KSB1 bacterium]
MEQNNSELVIGWYLDFESRFSKFLEFIPFNNDNKDNKDSVLPLLASILVEAGSLIDSIFREESTISTKPKDKQKINDFVPHYENRLNLSNQKTILFTYPLQYLTPFRGWIEARNNTYQKIDWWYSYNKMKHNRIEKPSLTTMNITIRSLCGLHQIISLLPTFFEALIRHDLVRHVPDLEFVKNHIHTADVDFTVLIETKLFGTAIGRDAFPDNPLQISPFYFGCSPKLRRFLGRNM